MAAYDPKVLGEKAKKRALVALKGIVSDVSQWVQDSAKESPTPYDDLALAIVPSLESWAVKKIDEWIGPVAP